MSNEIQAPKDKSERDARLDLVLGDWQASPTPCDCLHVYDCTPEGWTTSRHNVFGFAELRAYGLPFIGLHERELEAARKRFGVESDCSDVLNQWLGINDDQQYRLHCADSLSVERVINAIKQTPYEGAPQ